MEIEVGKSYRSLCFGKVTIVRRYGAGWKYMFPFVGMTSEGEESFKPDGSYHTAGPDWRDLIEPWDETLHAPFKPVFYRDPESGTAKYLQEDTACFVRDHFIDGLHLKTLHAMDDHRLVGVSFRAGEGK